MQKISELIYDKEFEQVKVSGFLKAEKNGYLQKDVDVFLEEIGPQAEELEKENEELKKNNAFLEQKIQEMQRKLSEMQSMQQNSQEEIMKSGLEQAIDEDESLKNRVKQIDNIERSYRKILFAAEEEAEEIRKVANQEARKILFETKQKSEILLKQVNIRCEEKEKELSELQEKEVMIHKDLLKISDYIQEISQENERIYRDNQRNYSHSETEEHQ